MIKKLIKKITIKTRCIESTWTVLMIKKIRENLKFVCIFTFFNAFFNGQKEFKVNALYIM